MNSVGKTSNKSNFLLVYTLIFLALICLGIYIGNHFYYSNDINIGNSYIFGSNAYENYMTCINIYFNLIKVVLIEFFAGFTIFAFPVSTALIFYQSIILGSTVFSLFDSGMYNVMIVFCIIFLIYLWMGIISLMYAVSLRTISYNFRDILCYNLTQTYIKNFLICSGGLLIILAVNIKIMAGG
jgi:hypothetical protein